MSAYNTGRKNSVKFIEQDFKEAAKIPPNFSLDDGKKLIKRLTTILRDMTHSVNKNYNMEEILILNTQGSYNSKVQKAEE